MSKSIKILTLSSKGGVGKSTIAMQIATPYLYQYNNNQPIKYYEFDDENKDYLSFENSKLSEKKSVEVSSDTLMDDITEIFSQDKNVCIDIGGNKTTTLALKAFYNSGMINFVDLVMVPLLDGEQDGINASVIYNTLRHLNKKIRILFVLNRVKSVEKVQYQFENYFGDPRGIFSNKYALKTYLDKKDFNNYAMIVDTDLIKYSRRFGLTIYEIAKQREEYIDQLRDNMDNYSKESEFKLISFKNYIDINSKEYYESVLTPIFDKIDDIITTPDED